MVTKTTPPDSDTENVTPRGYTNPLEGAGDNQVRMRGFVHHDDDENEKERNRTNKRRAGFEQKVLDDEEAQKVDPDGKTDRGFHQDDENNIGNWAESFLERLYRRSKGVIDHGDYVTIKSHRRQGVITNDQLRRAIILHVMVKGNTDLKVYKGNKIDQRLTQQAAQIASEMMQPGQPLHAHKREVRITDTTPDDPPPWRGRITFDQIPFKRYSPSIAMPGGQAYANWAHRHGQKKAAKKQNKLMQKKAKMGENALNGLKNTATGERAGAPLKEARKAPVEQAKTVIQDESSGLSFLQKAFFQATHPISSMRAHFEIAGGQISHGVKSVKNFLFGGVAKP